MKTQATQSKNPESQSKEFIQSKQQNLSTLQLKDMRPETTAIGEFQDLASRSSHVSQLQEMQSMANVAESPVQLQENKTGLPDTLKSGIENLSGYSMNDVKVHYNSDKPAQLNAHAYAQGTEIHLASGQEKHLPHEAWHVVQQKQGRVQPTKQLKGKVNINDNAGLEKEADIMGAKAFTQTKSELTKPVLTEQSFQLKETLPIQRVVHNVVPSVIHTPAALSVNARARLQYVVDTLAATLHNDPNMTVQQLIVSVEQEGGLDYQGGNSTIAGDNPAQTITTMVPPDPFPFIQITVQRAFAEKATEGEMLGLLAHEVGVHNIPSDFKGVVDAGVNAFAPVHTARKTAKNNTASGGYEFANWPVPLAGVAPAYRDGNRQHDHVMLADTLRNPAPAVGLFPLTRANVYLETVLNIGDTIWAGAGTPAEKRTRINEMIHLYLVDIGRVVASDDGRMPPASHGLALFDVYSEVFTQVLLPQQGAHAWIPDEQPKSYALTLAGSLIAFIAKVKLEKKLND